MKLYDKKTKQLVYIQQKADPHYWSSIWQKDLKAILKRGNKNSFIKKTTSRFLKTGKILEAGCGRGDKVYGLSSWGYDAYGIDYAKQTIKKINQLFPELHVKYGDVLAIPYQDNFFDGYWSLGVIEHFFSGYDQVIKEAKRVIKPGGYAFITFPYMSPIRKLKGFFGIYPKYQGEKENFYQFALNKKQVINQFKKAGFKPVYIKPFDAVNGLVREIKSIQPLLRSKNIFIRITRKALNILFSWFMAHSLLLVFKNTK